MDELQTDGTFQSKWIASLDKELKEDRTTLKNEFNAAQRLLERLEPILKATYREYVDKDYDMGATNYAVQVAHNAGYRKALRDLHRILYPEVTNP